MTDQIPPTPPTEPTSEPGDPDAAGPVTDTRTGPGARTWIVTALVVALIAGGVVFLVTRSGSSSSASGTGAAQGPGAGQGRGPGTRGTISSIKGSTLTVDQTDGTVTKIVTDSSTTVSMTIDGTLADVAVGDQVTVLGTVTGTSISATQITDQGNAAELQAQRQQQQQQRQQNGQTGQNAQNGQNGPNGSGQGFTPPTDSAGNTVVPPGGPGGSIPADGQGRQRGNGNFPGGAGGGFTMGEVTAKTATSLTVKANDGTEYTVTLAGDGKVSKTVTGKVSDLKVGETVTVQGTTAADGTVTASRIVSGTAAAGGPGGFGGGPPGGVDGQGNGLRQGPSTTTVN